MLQNLRIGTRLNIGFTLVLVTVLSLIVPIVIMKISDVVHEAENTALTDYYQSAVAEIASEGRLAQAMSQIMADTPELQAALAEGRRDDLAARTVPMFNELKQRYAVRQFQFHTPPATSFLRVHKPNKFGDDLSAFRKTIVATNKQLKPIQGLEKGVAGLGIRGITPMFYNGQHIGSVEFGLSFGQSFFENFKKKYGVDIALHIDREGVFETFGSTLNSELLTQQAFTDAMAGDNVIQRVHKNGIPYAAFAKTISDFSGNAIGVMEIALDRTHYVEAISGARNITLAIGALALGIGLAIAWFISASITRPLCNAVIAMNDIAQGEGDLTKRLDDSGKNEIARLAMAFNQFAEKVRLTVAQVMGFTVQLASAAEQMATIAQQTNQGVQQQLLESEQVATAMNEMTATVQEVARHSTEASGSAKDADKQANVGVSVVEQTIASINLLDSDIAQATNVINKVGEDSDSIGSVLDVIRGIAEQTNLLALNAAIEAARAGEQGRGFAVVADEVRTLASRTQESTQEIQAMIERLQNGAREAVQVMESSRNRSQDSVNQAAEAGTTLKSITQAITSISEMNFQIASAAKEQSSVAEEINKNVVNISQVVGQTADGAQQTFTASNELSQLANKLQQLVDQFKT